MRLTSWCGITSTAKAMWAALAMAWATGVGIDIHENPRLSMTCHDTVQVGHILTVEPGIYLPGVGGVRIEDTCLVTPEGNEPLTPATKELIIL